MLKVIKTLDLSFLLLKMETSCKISQQRDLYVEIVFLLQRNLSSTFNNVIMTTILTFLQLHFVGQKYSCYTRLHIRGAHCFMDFDGLFSKGQFFSLKNKSHFDFFDQIIPILQSSTKFSIQARPCKGRFDLDKQNYLKYLSVGTPKTQIIKSCACGQGNKEVMCCYDK